MTSSPHTGVLGEPCTRAFFDELKKIAEAKKELPLKTIGKNVLLATAGGAVGVTAGKLIELGLHKALSGKKIPVASLKYVAPILGVSSAALTLMSQAKLRTLAHEIVYGSENHE